MERRLAAILAADIVGYSRMLGEDEKQTLSALSSMRSDLFDPLVAEHGGQVLKRMGDGWIVEFGTISNAIDCALAVQEGLRTNEAIQLRIGVHVGDITHAEDDVYGDGINIASRLESLAEGGQVLISDSAYNGLDGRSAAQFSGGGARALKNISRPVGIWYWPNSGNMVASAHQPDRPALSEGPSIAVLPFRNMSGDPEQEYFSDGVSEEITTALGRFRWFFVISRNTAFTYRDRLQDSQAIAKELGVSYIVDGSLRKAGDRFRVGIELIQGADGRQIWSERFDRSMDDIFEVQDEIARSIAGAIEPELARAERSRAKATRPDNLVAWDLVQRGMWHSYKFTPEDFREALELFEKARELEPTLSQAYSNAAVTLVFQYFHGRIDHPEGALSTAVALARRAVEIDGQDYHARYALGRALTMSGNHRDGIPELEYAVSLNPSVAQVYSALGNALTTCGRAEEALEPFQMAMRLSPRDPLLGQFLARHAEALLYLRRHEEALADAEKSMRQPNMQWSRYMTILAICGHLGRHSDCERYLAELADFDPRVNLGFVRRYCPVVHKASLEYLLEGLVKAGMKE